MPLEVHPTIVPTISGIGVTHESVFTNSITRVIGGGNIQFAGTYATYPHMSTNFQNVEYINFVFFNFVVPPQFRETSLISISPISVRENINIDGVGTQNCSLYNRAIQAKLMIEVENTATSQFPGNNVYFPSHFFGDLAPQIDFEAGDVPLSIDDYTPPTLTLNETALVTYIEVDIFNITIIGNVYESAYYYFQSGGTRSSFGKHAFNNSILFTNSGEGANYSLYPPEADANPGLYGVANEEMKASLAKEWVIKNGDGSHRDWSYNYSDTPNGDEFVTFAEDHWLIYDFGVNDQQIIGKIKLDFSYRDAHRHNHIEIYGSNDPNIFVNNPPTENVHPEFGPGNPIIQSTPNQTWTYICDLTNTVSEGTFTDNGIIDQELTNTTPEGFQYGGTNNVLYRWYMLRFKSDGFEDDELRVQRIRFYKKDISNVSEVKMSDFYGLYLLNCIPAAPHFGENNPKYLSGYKIRTEVIGELRLGSPFS